VFNYFPKNYMWSSALMLSIRLAVCPPCGQAGLRRSFSP